MRDGSHVTLNTDSTIKVAFDEHERRIELERGEAFFEVAKDKSRPFVVNVGGKRIIAVGTQFSVRREGDEIQIIVTEGTVRYEGVSRTGPVVEEQTSNSEGSKELIARKQILLPAGTMARTDQGNVLLTKASIPMVEQNLTWRSGLLSFQETRLSDAVKEFNRYNTRKIVIRDPQIAGIKIGGIFGANAIDPFVHLLESGFAINATEQGDEIVLSVR
jgi:transmembrane sensor